MASPPDDKESPGQDESLTSHLRRPSPCNTQSVLSKEELVNHIKGVIYGNCIGDAIGLLTEFMTKTQAKYVLEPPLEYSMKLEDYHRCRWDTGDWTDDSDQMILILQSLVDNDGKMLASDFAHKLIVWSRKGFEELGDKGGVIGQTTRSVLGRPEFLADPHQAARDIWEMSGKEFAPNGGVMRTSILGTHDFGNIDAVIENTKIACAVTHADLRCIASCVAVTTAIAMMLQGKHWKESEGYDVESIIKDAYGYACNTLDTDQEREELRDYMLNYSKSLDDLKLDEDGKIGYTYKCLGAGFWSLRQSDFRAALEAITFEAGDADTNGAVAGALLGCKLGATALPTSWLEGLKHKQWLDRHITSYLKLLGLSGNEEQEIV